MRRKRLKVLKKEMEMEKEMVTEKEMKTEKERIMRMKVLKKKMTEKS